MVDEEHYLRAKEEFACMGIDVVGSQKLLAGIIESESAKKSFVEELMKKRVAKLECLTMIASTQPQTAFAAFTNLFSSNGPMSKGSFLTVNPFSKTSRVSYLKSFCQW